MGGGGRGRVRAEKGNLSLKSLSDSRCAPTSLTPRTHKQGSLLFCACVRVWLEVKLIIIKEDNEFQGMRRAIAIYGEVGSYGIPSCVPLFPQTHSREKPSLFIIHPPPLPPLPTAWLPVSTKHTSTHTQMESV